MNSLLEAKLLLSKVKTKLLDVTDQLVSDDTTDKQDAIGQLLKIVEYIEKEDITVEQIKESL
ncbi:hypothetical protein D0469_03420 [Peribacillus saganii]|uniref:Uncharacterized protein n=1 Tax=Peribacillus saganii TaxID=2303992 RepID=A0A372LS43_9BACI|nr:hypothetical protein [Peribacillus saganii]RFU71003.1 hypothetical protein D0469_03420 [Peribacillus saganii]